MRLTGQQTGLVLFSGMLIYRDAALQLFGYAQIGHYRFIFGGLSLARKSSSIAMASSFGRPPTSLTRHVDAGRISTTRSGSTSTSAPGSM